MRKPFAFLSLALFLVASAGVLAHAGHHHVMGTIAAVDANHFEVKMKDGKSTSVPLRPSTKYFQGEAAVAASDLKVGARVVIDLAKDGTASEVRLSAGKTGSQRKGM